MPKVSKKILMVLDRQALRAVVVNGLGYDKGSNRKRSLGVKDNGVYASFIVSNQSEFLSLDVENDCNIKTTQTPDGVMSSAEVRYLEDVQDYVKYGGPKPEYGRGNDYVAMDDMPVVIEGEGPEEESAQLDIERMIDNMPKDEALPEEELETVVVGDDEPELPPEPMEPPIEEPVAEVEEEEEEEEPVPAEVTLEERVAGKTFLELRGKKLPKALPPPRKSAERANADKKESAKRPDRLPEDIRKYFGPLATKKDLKMVRQDLSVIDARLKRVEAAMLGLTNAILLVVNGGNIERSQVFRSLGEVPEPDLYLKQESNDVEATEL
jgi:hypothetical protein